VLGLVKDACVPQRRSPSAILDQTERGGRLTQEQ